MSKISAETMAQYEKTMQRDPHSKVFAALADAYRERGRWGEAEVLARNGIERHPEYVGGYLVLARILLATRRAEAAEGILKKAVGLSPENLLAYQLLGQCFVELKRPEEALKAHKMVLFLNPLSEKSRQAVEKLETLTAVDYDDEVFEMRPLANSSPIRVEDIDREEAPKSTLGLDLERGLSLIDALIVRNDLDKARVKLKDLSESYPDSAEVQKRWSYFEEEIVEPGEELRPLLSRERDLLERKKKILSQLLRRIEARRLSRSPQ